MDFAAGDSCFYIGLGNTKTNAPTFEPYQCCPKPQSHATEKEKTGKPTNKETKTSKNFAKHDESKTNGKPENNNKKKDKRNKKDNGKASWWW